MTAGSPAGQAGMERAVRGGTRSEVAPPAARVRFVADLVCPWCFIGFRRLRRVLGEGAVTWHPFLLNPHLPSEGVARSRYLERKFGSLVQAQRLHGRVGEVGAREGIRFAFSAIRTQPSTVLAHALVLAAAEQGDPAPAAEALFAAFFERGVDIGDRQALRTLAREAGLRSDALDQPGWAQRVVRAHADACRFGINGVPICAFGEDHVIAGAQPAEALQVLLDLERYRLAARPG